MTSRKSHLISITFVLEVRVTVYKFEWGLNVAVYSRSWIPSMTLARNLTLGNSSVFKYYSNISCWLHKLEVCKTLFYGLNSGKWLLFYCKNDVQPWLYLKISTVVFEKKTVEMHNSKCINFTFIGWSL